LCADGGELFWERARRRFCVGLPGDPVGVPLFIAIFGLELGETFGFENSAIFWMRGSER